MTRAAVAAGFLLAFIAASCGVARGETGTPGDLLQTQVLHLPRDGVSIESVGLAPGETDAPEGGGAQGVAESRALGLPAPGETEAPESGGGTQRVAESRALVPLAPSNVFLAQVLALADSTPRGLLELGNRLYRENRFSEAVTAYRAVLSQGFESGHLHYNLGNAHFKNEDLGRAILSWERARSRLPADPDVEANLELARSLTLDEIEPLPSFWLFAVLDWWIGLVPGRWLSALVASGWLAVTGGFAYRLLVPRAKGGIPICSGLVILVLFGGSLVVRESGWGRPSRAVILEDVVPVRSAPTADDDLTLFRVHEGTTARIDARADGWVEIVLEDGKVGWVPTASLEEI